MLACAVVCVCCYHNGALPVAGCFVFELMFGQCIQAYSLLVPRLSLARACPPIAHCQSRTHACLSMSNICLHAKWINFFSETNYQPKGVDTSQRWCAGNNCPNALVHWKKGLIRLSYIVDYVFHKFWLYSPLLLPYIKLGKPLGSRSFWVRRGEYTSIRFHRRTPTAVTTSEPNVKCNESLILCVSGWTAFCVAYQSSVANAYNTTTSGVKNQTKNRREETRGKRKIGTEPASSTSRLGGVAVCANLPQTHGRHAWHVARERMY